MSDDKVCIGNVAGVFGIHGEVKCDPTELGRTFFVSGANLEYSRDEKRGSVTLANVREHKGRLLLSFEHVTSVEEAQAFVGVSFFVSRTDAREQLGKTEYLDADLVGCTLEDVNDGKLGVVSAVEHYPASDMLVVGGRMVPLVRAFVRHIDVAGKRIVVDLPAGLLD